MECEKVHELKESVINNEIKSVKRLLKDDKSFINTPVDSDGTTLLHLSVSNDVKLIQLLIDNGAHVNTRTNSEGYSPLHVAVINGYSNSVSVLLVNGADVNIIDNDCMTPRDHAEDSEDWDIVNIIDNNNSTVIDRKEEEEMCDISVCEMFVNMTIAHQSTSSQYEEDTVQYEGDTVLYEEDTVQYNGDASKLCGTDSLSNEQLREKLISFGEQPGPINSMTRNVYISYLQKIINGTQRPGNNSYKGYKYELALCLNGTLQVPDLQKMEDEAFAEFRVAGQSKSYFNYILLDPRGSNMSKSFNEFVECIFYVGKGKNARSHQHLKDAKQSSMKSNDKVKRINDIWTDGFGVISLHVFNHISASEAYCREGAIIDALGMINLTNAVRGHYHGTMSHWSASQKRMFGVYLLNKTFLSYKIDTPQQLYNNDI